MVDWEVFTPKQVRLYRGRAKRGRPPYNSVVILRILTLSYLYDLSKRQVEAYVNDSLSAKYFLGLAVDEAGLDHTTPTKFKERIERRGKGLLEELLKQVLIMGISSWSLLSAVSGPDGQAHRRTP